MIRRSKPNGDGTVRITFTLPANEPDGPVSVVGDFNGWDPYAHPLRRRGNGVRSATITVPKGSTLCFRYLGDRGVWFDDDQADGRDSRGSLITT
jgi:1,4-alpha-glucan branching enzyme